MGISGKFSRKPKKQKMVPCPGCGGSGRKKAILGRDLGRCPACNGRKKVRV